jgi:hypothetical protein
MPYLKFRKGHASPKALIQYLRREGKHHNPHSVLGYDYLNCSSRADDIIEHRDVWEQMDDTRRAYENDTDYGSLKCRTYQHLIISPNPKDSISLEDLQDLTLGLIEKHFGDFECFIVYHNDNESRIPHAHVVINNTNLETGRRIAPYLTKTKVGTIRNDLQARAKAMGLHSFEQFRGPKSSMTPEDLAREKEEREEGGGFAVYSDFSILDKLDGDQDELDTTRSPGAESEGGKARTSKSGGGGWSASQQAEWKGTAERKCEDKGEYSWVGDIRQRVSAARHMAGSIAEFKHLCHVLGIDIAENKKGDFIYSFANRESRKVSGTKMGTNYSKSGIEKDLAAKGGKVPPKKAKENAVGLLGRIAVKQDASVNSGDKRTIVGFTVKDGADVTMAEVVAALTTNAAYGIQSMEDYARARPVTDSGRDDIAKTKATAAGIGLFDGVEDSRPDLPTVPEVPKDTRELTPAEKAALIAKHYAALGVGGSGKKTAAQDDSKGGKASASSGSGGAVKDKKADKGK